MNTLSLFLKIAAPVFIGVGVLHLVFGLKADVMLGADVPARVLLEPTLDSQNRFYGVTFTLYGVLLYLCAGDLPRYRSVALCVFTVFFLAGLARLVSLALLGMPSAPTLFLLALELVLPPLLVVWLRRVVPASTVAQ